MSSGQITTLTRVCVPSIFPTRMGHTRRRFFKVVGIAAGGVSIAGAVAYRHAKDRAGAYYRRWVELPKEGEVGALDDTTLSALMSATTILLVEGIERDRYEDFFKWHAENAPGYKRIYERFAAAIGDDDASRARALQKIAGVRETINRDNKVGGLRLALFDRDWLLFERYVVREILTLFGRTDAWLLSGYGSPPGVPRLLVDYRKPPA